MSFLWPLLLGGALCLFTGGVGYHIRDLRAQNEAVIAKAAFDKRVEEAQNAYATQHEKTAGRMRELEQLASQTPPDPAIAFNKDAATRIWAIR